MRRRLLFATAIFAVALSALAGEPAKKLLIIGQGPDGHPHGAHEYMAGARIIQELLKQFPDIAVTAAKVEEPWTEGPELIQQADGIVLFACEGAKLIAQDPRRQEAVARLIERGGGLVALHWGIGAKEEQYFRPFVQWLGGMHNGADRKFRMLNAELTPAEPRHPTADGIEPAQVYDEFYYDLKFGQVEGKTLPVLEVAIDERPYTVAWAFERPDGGRSFGFSGLHFHKNWKRPEYRRLVTQGILWSLKLPVPPGGANVELADEVYELPKEPVSQ